MAAEKQSLPIRASRLALAGFGWLILLGLSHLVADEPLPKPLAPVQHPATNPAIPAKIALGKKLFFDPRLSRIDRISCASCHDPAKGFSNGEKVGRGVDGKKGTRNVPSLVNAAYNRSLFWDGRAATLEAQALVPIQHPKEMNLDLGTLVRKLNAIPEYRRQFQAVFGGPATAPRVAQALAAFERTIVSNDTPFDRYLKGDHKALSPPAQRGMSLFFGQARCFVCHKGSRFTDDDFHNIGIVDEGQPDPGRRSVTGKKVDQGKFRTPGLREVGRTAPYMHNGRFQTLTQVVEHYNFGGVTDQENDHRDDRLQVLYLSEDQVNDLVHFLAEGLTSPLPAASQRHK
jgi:cytochrome c peroxidase